MKIPSSIVTRLNLRYVSEIDVHNRTPNESRAITDNVRVFLDRAVRKGNAVSLVDIDLEVSEARFWDIEHFEDVCKNAYFTFKPGFTTKLIRRLPDISQEDLQYYLQILGQNPVANKDAVNHPIDPYLHFIGKKIQSLQKTEIFNEIIRLDMGNRGRLLRALQQNKIEFDVKETSLTKTPIFSFSEMLHPTNESIAATKSFIQDMLTEASIPFELMQLKPIPKTNANKNPDGFNGALAAMITVFKDLGYFKPGLTLPEVVDAYLQESGNTIGKLSFYKRSYFQDNYYIQYKKSLEELKIKKISSQS